MSKIGKRKEKSKKIVVRINRGKSSWTDKKLRALESITKIEALLHRHGFDGDYSYTELEERLGSKIKIEDRKGQNYRSVSNRKTGFIWFNGYRLRLFWDRIYPRSAQCIIEISSPSQEYLARLNEALPNLHLDSIEYTVDLYCSGWIALRSLFKVLVRYSYVPYTKAYHLDLHRESNRTYHGKDLRVYERGEDDTGLRPGWSFRDINRVRVEFTAGRYILEKHGIIRLEAYLRDCHFEDIFLPGFQFKVFEGSNQLPKENDSYAQKGGHESLQQHLIEIRKRGRPKNPTQYMVDATGFDELKKRVVRKIRNLDKDWRANYLKILKNQITRTGKRRVHS